MKLEICDVSKQYKDKCAVDHANLTLTPGVWGLLGANGAGKTTLMRMIAGIMKPTGGEIRYDGIEIDTLGEKYRDIFGYLPQEFGFYPGFSVQDYLEYMAALKGIGKKETKEKIQELLEIVSLTDVRKKKIVKLSGGMKRRVGIAQALLNDPKVLILDEPTSGLDPGERMRFRNLLSEFGRNRIVLISTHIVSDVEYIGEACKIARKYFKVIGLEVYPMNSDEYAYLHKCGADYVTVFQETYNSDKYGTLHLAGHKRIFPYRMEAQERAIRGGMRGVGFAALLGLDDFRKDAFATGMHAYLLQRKYPHAEIAFSCPRLRPIINNDKINPMDVHEKQLLQVVTAYRLFMPFASITVSTREGARVRDSLMEIAATKISAGVSTGIGSHAKGLEDQGDEQFEISDGRTVKQVYDALLEEGLQPVMSDYIYV